jgi:hypothetical protein
MKIHPFFSLQSLFERHTLVVFTSHGHSFIEKQLGVPVVNSAH